MRLANVLINAALFALATVVSVAIVLGAGELYLRTRTKANPRSMPWTVFHPDRGWALQPGEYVHFDLDESRETRVSINDLGMRNPPVSLAVPPGKKRMSILGDSFVFGAALNDGETVVGQLRGMLGDRYEVVNLGVEGYGTGTETLWIEDLVSRGYVPGEAIVLVFFTNDILDNLGLAYSTGEPQSHIPSFWVDGTGALQHTRPETLSAYPWGQKLARRWMFYRYLRTRAANLMLANPWMLDLAEKLGFHPKARRTPGVVEGFYSPGWQNRWRTTEQVLAHLSRLARERLKSQLYIVFVPSPFQVVAPLQKVVARQAPGNPIYAAFLQDVDRPQRCLREFCARTRLPFIDTTAPLRRGARARPPYFPFEAHLNPFGAGIVAAAIRGGVGLPAHPPGQPPHPADVPRAAVR